MKMIFCLILSLFIWDSLAAQDSLKVKQVISVYDGDTFKVDLHCDSTMEVFCEAISVRVHGVDCPEMRGKCENEKRLAKIAQACADSFLHSGDVVLKNLQRDKYFRLLADAFVHQTSLADLLLQEGLAIAYDGGTKKNIWCKTKINKD